MQHINIVDLKMTREALCAAQAGLHPSGRGTSISETQSYYLQKIIDQIDELRPLDENGEHTTHTAFCGCEDSTIKLCKHCEREIVLHGDGYNQYWTHIHSNSTSCFHYFRHDKFGEPMLEVTDGT